MYEKHTLMDLSEQKILEVFLDIRRHYFAEISKKTGLTRPRTMRALRKLEEAGVLTSEEEANIKYYSLYRNPPAYLALGMVEYAKADTFLERNKAFRRAMEMFRSSYHDYLIMLVFGSHAKGQASKSSDIDLLLVKEGFSKEEVKMVEDMISMVNGRTGLKISPYMIKAGELRQRGDFDKEVIENHVLLEGAELFYRLVLE